MIQKFRGELGVAYIATLEERVVDVVVETKEEPKEEIKKALVPTQMEVKAFNKVKELLEKESLTEFEAVTLAQLQSFLKTSSINRLAQE